MVKRSNGQMAKLGKKLRLPIDNSRKFLSHVFWPAKLGYLLTLIAIILAALGLHNRLFPENERLAKLNQAVLAKPFNPQPHRLLGRYYLDQGYLQQAKHELVLATRLGSPTAGEMYADIKRKKDRLQQEALLLEKELKDKPDFRNAHIKLAAIYYQLRELKKAKANLEKARKIDPNYEPTLKLEKLLTTRS